jgi:hypothetical protein
MNNRFHYKNQQPSTKDACRLDQPSSNQPLRQFDLQTVAVLVEDIQAGDGHVARGGLADSDLLTPKVYLGSGQDNEAGTNIYQPASILIR